MVGNLEELRKDGERDPHGLAPTAPGAKLDLGKIDMSRALREFPNALSLVSRVGDYGAKKYSEGGWRDVPNGVQRYGAAMLRHFVLEGKEVYDPETDLVHAAQVAWNALARLQILWWHDISIARPNVRP